MNRPNKITIFRMVLVIPFTVMLALAVTTSDPAALSYGHFNKHMIFLVASGFIFVIAMISDTVDGFIARKRRIVTTFGKIFDPIADKFITTSALVVLSVARIVPFYLTLVFILRDIVVDGSRKIATSNKIEIAASVWGKLKTIFQSIALVIILFLFPLSLFDSRQNVLLLNIPLMIAALLSLFSGWKYLQEVVPLIRKSR